MLFSYFWASYNIVLRLGPQKSLDYHPHVIDASFDASADIKIIQNLQSK